MKWLWLAGVPWAFTIIASYLFGRGDAIRDVGEGKRACPCRRCRAPLAKVEG